jgi:translation elongation factor EF-Tu-like GTPase
MLRQVVLEVIVTVNDDDFQDDGEMLDETARGVTDALAADELSATVSPIRID